ncbi:uncharacterized protein N7518_005054 [Penicillium psychrosexuale]|uniref:uncharacterized protein n=1 Tax=Penicillium psychrosexuale TaxID=1002107 RepID=UPI0025451545|nr:uncharacterized protein N7518_005054 [Penicillium psychrosexuale]KAJ5796514.1 hypothetical protein N7518_005054 [Penicillium psychrosexuale]
MTVANPNKIKLQLHREFSISSNDIAKLPQPHPNSLIPTASMIASLPTPPAIATGSYGIAAVIGADDNALTKPQDLTAIAAIAVRAMNPTKPLTVGMQNGHGDVSELADIITQVIAIGAVRYNLEDIDATGVLRSVDEATAWVGVVICCSGGRKAGVPDFVP